MNLIITIIYIFYLPNALCAFCFILNEKEKYGKIHSEEFYGRKEVLPNE